VIGGPREVIAKEVKVSRFVLQNSSVLAAREVETENAGKD